MCKSREKKKIIIIRKYLKTNAMKSNHYFYGSVKSIYWSIIMRMTE